MEASNRYAVKPVKGAHTFNIERDLCERRESTMRTGACNDVCRHLCSMP